MKKSSIYCILIASLILVTGCKKDQDTVTLSAVINQPSKVFINDQNYPCWESGNNPDMIYVNDAPYPVSDVEPNNRTVAKLQVVSCTNGYRAIYPASIVPEGSDILNNTVQVTLPSRQIYNTTSVSGVTYQKVQIPMGAYIASGNTLRFSNLCSVIRVTVDNPSDATEDRRIKEIRIDADNTYLSGTGTAAIGTNDDNNKITISNVQTNKKYVVLSQQNTDYRLVNLEPGQSKSFDIVVPEFSDRDNITITVTAEQGYKKMKFDNVTLDHSSYVATTINVKDLRPNPAKLVSGPTFNSRVKNNFVTGSTVTKIKFEYNISTIPASYTELKTSDSPTSIYGYVSGDTYIVATKADSIYASGDCSKMFMDMVTLTDVDFGSQFNTKNTTSIYQMFYGCNQITELEFPETFYTDHVTNMGNLFYSCSSLQRIVLPETFNTDLVTLMDHMFYNCSSLTTIECGANTTGNVLSLNTANVTTFQAMFSGCSSLQTLDISSFDISNVQSMYSMFYQCGALSSLTLPSNLNAPALTTMQSMFSGCSNLTSINLTSLATDGSLTNTREMFDGCNKLTSLNLSNLNTTQVTQTRSMFKNCKKLGTLTLGYNFEINRNIIQYYGDMFLFTGESSGGCTVHCTQSIVDFITDDRAGQVSSTRNNAKADNCTFIADVTAPPAGSK